MSSEALPNQDQATPVDTTSNGISSSDKAAYFMNEFFFSMLPCYIFLITAAVRYFRVQNKPIKIQEVNLEDTSKSFRIKVRLSQFQALTYVVALILGLLGPSKLFWGAKFGWSNCIYILGFLAWVASDYLLNFEYARDQNQALYGHRVFWIFSFCFGVMRLFEDYMALFNVILSVARLIPNLILLMYAMYKPFDQDKAFQDYDSDIPSFARIFFEKIENNAIVAKLIGYSLQNPEDRENDLFHPLSEDIEMQDNAQGFVETILQENSRTQNTQNSFDMEKQLYNQLPRRNVVVNKIIERRIEENKPKFYYTVITQINTSNYKVSKKYKQFEDIFEELSGIYTLKNYPKLDKTFPNLVSVKHTDADCEKKRVKNLQDWFSEVFAYPLFIHQRLLEFLNIDEASSAPFIVYFTHVTKMKGNLKQVLPVRKGQTPTPGGVDENTGKTGGLDQQMKAHLQQFTPKDQIEKRMMRYNSTAQRLVEIEHIIQQRKEDFSFKVSCKRADKQAFGTTLDYVFEFQFEEKQRWTISKTLTEIKEFNSDLEDYIGFSVHYFNQFVQPIWSIKDSLDKQHVKQKVAALDSYIKALFDQKLYYCQALFEFVEFDPEREIHLNSRMCTPRETLDGIPNSDGDKMPGSSALSQLQGLTDEREQGVSRLNQGGGSSGLKGVNLQNEFNLADISEQFSKNQLILEKRGLTGERIVYGVDLNRSIITVQKILTQQLTSSQFKNEIKTVTSFCIYLEEFDTFGLVKLRIILLKTYNHIKILDALLTRVYVGILDQDKIQFPRLPYERTPSVQSLADQMRREFEVYFEELFKLPRISENDSLQRFLHLNELLTATPTIQGGVQVYDFRQSEDNS